MYIYNIQLTLDQPLNKGTFYVFFFFKAPSDFSVQKKL